MKELLPRDRLARVVVAALALAWVTACSAATPRHASTPAGSRTAPAAAAQSAPRVVQAPYVQGPLVPQQVATPVAEVLTATPVARIRVGGAIGDPSQIVEASGRSGCNFSFRAALAGVLEYLFPSSGLFQAGDSLFRLYDPAVLQDLALAERAARLRDVGRFLVAGPRGRYPMGARVTVPEMSRMLVPGSPVVDFPSPVRDAAALPLRGARPSASGAAPAASPRVASRPRARPAGTRAELTSAPAATRSPQLREAAAEARRDLGRYERAVAEAGDALEEAQTRLSVAAEDFDAKTKLVQDGALPAKMQEDAADRLTQAEARVADCRMRLAVARDRLGSEQDKVTRAEELARAASDAAEGQPADVEVFRGTGAAPAAAGVEVVRGSGADDEPRPAAPVPRPRATREASAANSGPTRAASRSAERPARRPARFAFQEPARLPAGLSYRGVGPMVSTTLAPGVAPGPTLTSERWTDYRAPADGFVLACKASQGSMVQPGTELLQVINTQWARAYLPLSTEDAPKFRQGTTVSVTFDGYPDVAFEGWVNSLQPTPERDGFRAELVVFCRRGYYGTDAFATLQWLALATPLDQTGASVGPAFPVPPAGRTQPDARDVPAPMALVPPQVWQTRAETGPQVADTNTYLGQLQLVDLSGPQLPGLAQGPGRERLAKLKRWRDGFTEGMIRTLFGGGIALTYPSDPEVRRAVERMATGQVTHVPNRCARTMREALGWGLGDAHEWAYELPTCGWSARQDGLARPGDILVWPFSYPPRGSQHIGIAVEQNGRLMLLSNLDGYLGTTPIVGGYVAFHRATSG